MGDQFDLLGRGDLRLAQAALFDLTAGEVAHGETDAAHVQRFHQLRIVALADDELGRAASDIDDQALVRGRRQGVRGTEVNQAGLFTPGDDFDRKSQRLLRLRQKRRDILGHTQGIGSNGANGSTVESAQALAEATQGGQRTLLGLGIEQLVGGQAGSQAHRLLERIEWVDLVIDDAPDLETETVGTQVDRSYGFINHRLASSLRSGSQGF